MPMQISAIYSISHYSKTWPHFLPNKNEVLLCINSFEKCDPKCLKTSTVLLLFLYTRPRHILVIEIWSILPQNITTLTKQKSIFAKSPRNFTILFSPSLKMLHSEQPNENTGNYTCCDLYRKKISCLFIKLCQLFVYILLASNETQISLLLVNTLRAILVWRILFYRRKIIVRLCP